MSPLSISLHADVPACAGCARCCHLTVVLEPGADDHVPAEFVVERGNLWFMDQEGDGACVALDPQTRLCTIYEQRPQVCRIFERGSGLCRQVLGLPEV